MLKSSKTLLHKIRSCFLLSTFMASAVCQVLGWAIRWSAYMGLFLILLPILMSYKGFNGTHNCSIFIGLWCQGYKYNINPHTCINAHWIVFSHPPLSILSQTLFTHLFLPNTFQTMSSLISFSKSFLSDNFLNIQWYNPFPTISYFIWKNFFCLMTLPIPC